MTYGAKDTVRFFKFLRVFPEALPAFLACEGEFERLHQRMLLLLRMAFGAVEPFPACAGLDISGRGVQGGARTARGSDGDLGVENVFASKALAYGSI